MLALFLRGKKSLKRSLSLMPPFRTPHIIWLFLHFEFRSRYISRYGCDLGSIVRQQEISGGGFRFIRFFHAQIFAAKQNRGADFQDPVIDAGMRKIVWVLERIQRQICCDDQRLAASVSGVDHGEDLL